jgi:DNA invertase Pin-like site-specific DNA recombinase
MSTDMQRYSFDNQSEAIASYAARHGLTVAKSYEDSGRSGLRLKGRPALKQLINDVVSGAANFRVILVYDVSRWGRFQDIDESAYYEFICKEAGVVVQYCAEQFDNNNSLTATVIKSLKRAMAGEFSRELSVKVHAGQSRVAAMGFRVGASAGYSLRRFLLDEHGNRKMELTQGQRKSIQTERVILVPGSPEEIKTVHRVYDLFIDVAGRLWSPISVRELLANEKYIGTCLYNRTSKKLGVNSQRNPKDEWVRTPGAFEPIVSPERFSQARRS